MAGLPYGLQAMLKEGHKHFSGLEEAVLKNIEACKQLSEITRTSMGPNGMNKIVINHLDKMFVTSDASTIVSELDVFHPAAKLLAMAAKAQEQEVGDGTNLVLTLGGELLNRAEDLIHEGLHTADIIDGYNKACTKTLEVLEASIVPDLKDLDVRSKTEVAKRLRGAVSSKQNGFEDVLCPLIAEACVDVCPKNPHNFNVDNVRIVKIMGGSIYGSQVVKGMVFKRDVEGTVKSVEDAKVAVYATAVDTSGTETKGTVLIKNAEELESYSKSEEAKLEEYIKALADTGAKVVVSSSNFGEMAMHFIEKYGMMAMKIPSKFDLRRFCRATNAVALVKMQTPQPEELGFAKQLQVEEIGGENCVVLRQDSKLGSVSSIVLRGSTQGFLDDVERAVDDGVNAYKVLCKDSRVLPGGGAAEIEVAKQVGEYGRKQLGLEQYAIQQFAEAFEIVPRTLAESSGLNSSDVVSSLYAAHNAGQAYAGVDLESGQPKDMVEAGILDLYLAKWWAVKLAADAAMTVLKVDQIIMAKTAGGPKPPSGGMADDD